MSDYLSQNKRFCSVFKSPKRAEMYIYVDRSQDLEQLPEALLAVFGEPCHVLDMVLTPSKKLARVEADKVLADIEEKGFFLQMPPSSDVDVENRVQPPRDTLNG